MNTNTIVWSLSIVSLVAAWTFAEAMRQQKTVRSQAKAISVCLVSFVLAVWLGQ